MRLNVTRLISGKAKLGRFSVAGNSLAAIGDGHNWGWNVGNVVLRSRLEGFVFTEHGAVHRSELNCPFVEFVVRARRFENAAAGRSLNGVAGLNAAGQKLAGGDRFYSALVALHQLLLHLDHAFALSGVNADAGHVRHCVVVLHDAADGFGEALDLRVASLVHHRLDASFVLLEHALCLLDTSVFLVGEEETGRFEVDFFEGLVAIGVFFLVDF